MHIRPDLMWIWNYATPRCQYCFNGTGVTRIRGKFYCTPCAKIVREHWRAEEEKAKQAGAA